MKPATGFTCLLLLAGCASSNQGGMEAAPPPPRPVEIITSDAQIGLSVRREANVATVALAAAARDLWQPLLAAVDTLGLPLSSHDQGNLLLRSAGDQRVRTIGGTRVNTYFECAGTGYGNTANSGDVYVTLQAQLLGTGERSTDLRMQAEAYVMVPGASRVQCRSTGRLEQRIAQEVARRAGLGN